MSLEEEIRVLKLKRARIILEIEMLAAVNDSVYLALGKTEAAIVKLEKQLARETKNDLDEN